MKLKISNFLKIFLPVIAGFSFNCYSSNIAQEEYYLNRYLNFKTLSLSSSYRMIYETKKKNDFISTFYKDKNISLIERSNLNNLPLETVCENIYNGANNFERNKREGMVCLQLLTISGDPIGSITLSKIFNKEKNYEMATFFYAVYKTLSDKEDVSYFNFLMNNTNNFNEIYLNGLLSGAKFELIENTSKAENNFNISIFSRDIKDERYYNDSYIRFLYDSLKNNNFREFVKLQTDLEKDGSKLFLLSAAFAGDFDKLTEYCFLMVDQKIGSYCLSSVYNFNRQQSALNRYFYLQYSNFNDNINDVGFNDIYRLMGLNNKDFIVKNIFENRIQGYILNIKTLERVIRLYNEGRIVNKNLK